MKLGTFEKNKVDFNTFTPDIPVDKLPDTFTPSIQGLRFPFFGFYTIDALKVTKTVGKGRTNLTFIRSTIVQADATTPYAGFDKRVSLDRNPSIQMHFEPAAYGITSVSNYLMIFSVENFETNRFNLGGYAGGGTLGNAGPKVLTGKQTISLAFSQIQPNQTIYGFLEQTLGGAWNYYSTSIRFPYPIFLP